MLRKASFIALLLIGLVIKPAESQSIKIGESELVVSESNMPPAIEFPGGNYGFDGSFATLVNPDGTLDLFLPCGFAGMRRSTGTLKNPFQNFGPQQPQSQLFPNDQLFWEMPLINKTLVPWILNVYKIANNQLLGFLHIEDLHITGIYDCNTKYSIGLAYSADNGATWKFSGHIIRPKNNNGAIGCNAGTNGKGSNIGGVPYLVKDGFLYLYFNEFGTVGSNNNVKKLSVARANLSSVVASAQSGTVNLNDWKKYNSNNMANGGWNEASIGGEGSNIINPHPSYTTFDPFYDFHSDAVYSSTLRKYLITVSVDALGASTGNALLMYASDDCVNWSNPVVIDDAQNRRHPYSTFIPISTGSGDGREVGSRFAIYTPLTFGEWQTDLYMKKISIPFLIPSLHYQIAN